MLLFEAKVLKSTAIIHKYSKFPIKKQSQNTSYRVKLEHKLLGNFQEILVQDIKLGWLRCYHLELESYGHI